MVQTIPTGLTMTFVAAGHFQSSADGTRTTAPQLAPQSAPVFPDALDGVQANAAFQWASCLPNVSTTSLETGRYIQKTHRIHGIDSIFQTL